MTGYAIGTEAVDQIRRLIREEQAKFRNPEQRRARWQQRASGCGYYWEIYLENGTAPPSSGSSIFSVTLDSDEQDVTIDYDMTAAELSSELLSEFTALTAEDIEVTGGPLPVFPLYLQWKGEFIGHASEDYPPTAGTNSLNNSSQMKIRQINPRA